MKENRTAPANSEDITPDSLTTDNAHNKKKSVFTEKRIEVVVTILLGITTLLSAWASWIGHLHGGVQSINFTSSNNASSQATAEYNLCLQTFISDYMVWNTIMDYYLDLEEATEEGNQARINNLNKKIKYFKENNTSETLAEGIKWMEDNNGESPFDMPGITEKYFGSAEETIIKSQELLEEGKRDNAKGDAYLLVTVIYSLTLFLLGIIGTLKNIPNRITLLMISVVCLIFAFIYMCIIPMPTDFNNMNFFDFN